MAVTVQHEELLRGPSRVFDPEGGSATRLLLCNWDQGDQLAAELMGYIVAVGHTIDSRVAPARHPRYPQLEVNSVSVEGIGLPQDGNYTNIDAVTPRYEKARLTVQYGMAKDDGQQGQPDFTTITESHDSQAIIETIPGKWRIINVGEANDGETIGNSVGKRVAETTISVAIDKWINFPINDTTIDDLLGKINESSITFLFKRYDKETLLFTGFSHSRILVPHPNGTVVGAWAVNYSLAYRTQGWQKMLANDGRFVEVRSIKGNKQPYETGDLSRLLPF